VDGDNTRHIFGEVVGGGYASASWIDLNLEKMSYKNRYSKEKKK